MSTKQTTPVVTKLSPSRAKDFLQCPRLFYYKTVLGIRTPPTTATLKGTVAHYVFERVFDHPRGERGLDSALQYPAPALAMLLDPLVERSRVEAGSAEDRLRTAETRYRDLHEPGSAQAERLEREASELRLVLPTGSEGAFLEEVTAVVRGWYGMENPDKFDPAERELYLLAEVAGVPMHGFIDRLDRIPTPDGSPRTFISDYKTGKVPRPQYQDEAFFQLEVYALLLAEQLGETAHQLRLIYVREGHPSAVLTRQVTDQLLERTKAKVQAVWKGIHAAARQDQWQPRRQVLCDWCHFKDVCPAHRPDLEGLLPEEIELRLGGRLPA